MKYCCDGMREADKSGLIDYCPNALTTIDTRESAYPIHYCPFCGKRLKGTERSVRRIMKYAKK